MRKEDVFVGRGFVAGRSPSPVARPLHGAVDWAIVNTWEAARKLGDSGSLVRSNVAARDVRRSQGLWDSACHTARRQISSPPEPEHDVKRDCPAG